MVNFHTHFASVAGVCFTFAFERDLFDPGDSFVIDFGPTLGAIGATNVGATSLATRMLCTAQPEQLAAFRDGKQAFAVTVSAGSVTLTSATAEITP